MAENQNVSLMEKVISLSKQRGLFFRAVKFMEALKAPMITDL